MKLRIVLTLTALAAGTFGFGQRVPTPIMDICEGILCFNTRPTFGGDPPHVTGCECTFGACDGTCSCTPGKACATGESCPDNCMEGGGPNKPPTQKHLSVIANTVSQHQTMLTVFLKKATTKR